MVTTVRIKRTAHLARCCPAPGPAGLCKAQPKPCNRPHAAEGDGRPSREQQVTDSLDLREHQAIYTVQLVARVSRISRRSLPGRAAGQKASRFRHPAEHLRGQPPAGRGLPSCSTGPVRWTESQLTPYSNRSSTSGRQSDVETVFPADTATANLAPPRPARPGQLNLTTPGHRPVRRPDGSRLVDPAISSGREAAARPGPDHQIDRSTLLHISDLDLPRLLKVTRGIPAPRRRKWPVQAGAAEMRTAISPPWYSTSPPSTGDHHRTLLMRGILPNRTQDPAASTPGCACARAAQRPCWFPGRGRKRPAWRVPAGVNDKNVVERRNVTAGAAVDGRGSSPPVSPAGSGSS